METSSWFALGDSTTRSTQQRLISDSDLVVVVLVLGVFLHGLMACVGTFSNVLNIVVFSKMGVKDSMSTALLALSCSDCVVTSLQVASCLCYVVDMVNPDNPVDPIDLRYFAFAWTRYVAYLNSCWITALICTERCFCVVSPFHVRQMFTRSRCFGVIFIICVVHYGFHMPIFTTQKMEWVELEPSWKQTNETIVRKVLKRTFSRNRQQVEIIVDSVGIFTSVLSQTIIIVCSLWMIYALSLSARIRGNGATELCTQLKGHITIVKKSRITLSEQVTSNLSAREIRLVKLVLFLSVYLTICNIPNFVVITLVHTLPELDTESYANVEMFMFEFGDFFNTVCASMNCFIYMKFNSSYRITLCTLLETKFSCVHKHFKDQP